MTGMCRSLAVPKFADTKSAFTAHIVVAFKKIVQNSYSCECVSEVTSDVDVVQAG